MQEEESAEALECPVDGQEMVRQEHGVGHYHACMNCRGLWVPRTYLLALKRQASQQLKWQPTGAPKPLDPVSHATPLHCPQCANPLLPRMQEGVPIDVCGLCKAVWLDGDEVLQLGRQATKREQKEERWKELMSGIGDWQGNGDGGDV